MSVKMGNSSSSSDDEYLGMSLLESLSQQDAYVIAKTFCESVDKDRKMLLKALSNKVELLWFGRSINGPQNVVQFLDLIAPYSNHRHISAEEQIIWYSTSGSESEESMEDTDHDTEHDTVNDTERSVAVTELSQKKCIYLELEHLPIENHRKREATDILSFEDLRIERNDQKNRENLGNSSSMVSDNDVNLVSKLEISTLEGSKNKCETDQNSLEDQEVASKNTGIIEETNNNTPTPQNFMQLVTPAPVRHKENVNVGEILKKAGKNQKEKKKNAKPRVIKLRAQLFLGKLAQPNLRMAQNKHRIWEKKLKAIFITFDEKIEFIEYIGDSCARNLLKEFNAMQK